MGDLGDAGHVSPFLVSQARGARIAPARAGTAQYNYGLVHANGDGVPQDFVEAHMWFNLAAAQSFGVYREPYVKARDAVAEHMTAEQIAEAQRRAREWTPTPEP